MSKAASSNGGMEEKKGPTFFKMIKTGFNTEDLNIPPKFRKHPWNELFDRATLNLKDTSSTWTVKVSQTEGMTYFMSGWEKFVTDNSLGNFEFLIFRYEGNMQFSIDIFERIGIKRMKYVDPRYRRGETSGTSCKPFCWYFPEGYCTIVLKNSEGREWEVETVPNSLEVVTKTVKLLLGGLLPDVTTKSIVEILAHLSLWKDKQCWFTLSVSDRCIDSLFSC